MHSKKLQLIGMNLGQMETFMQSIKEPIYRANQLFNWIYKRRVATFDEMTNFSKALRTQLDNTAEIGRVKLIKVK